MQTLRAFGLAVVAFAGSIFAGQSPATASDHPCVCNYVEVTTYEIRTIQRVAWVLKFDNGYPQPVRQVVTEKVRTPVKVLAKFCNRPIA